jgi:pyrroline-5-carboxylate reductase
VGAGKMGEALIRGLLAAKLVPPNRICVSDVMPARRDAVSHRYGVRPSPGNAALAQSSDLVVLIVRPSDVPAVLADIRPAVGGQLLLSFAAGVRTGTIEAALGGQPRVLRAMPNLACAVGEGASAFAPGRWATEEDVRLVERLLGGVGLALRLPEELLDAVTALGGSGPGFLGALTEAMIEGGVRAGLARDVAERLALQTFVGTARLLAGRETDPRQLMTRVATPGGTTEEGLRVMRDRDAFGALSEAIVAAARRSAELDASAHVPDNH